MKKQMQNEDADRNDESFAEDRSLENEEEGSFRSNVGSNAITPKNRLLRRSSTASDGSLFDSINGLEDNLPRESQDTLCDTVEKLKTEVSNLMTQVDLSENRRAQDLSTQIADLKVKKDALKMECEKLKSSQKSAGGEELLKQLLHPHQRSSTASDGSINSLEDNLLRESQDTPSDTVEKLKTEVSNLMTQVDLSELEMQSLKKQIMEENGRAQDLSTQIVDLKVERGALKMECEKFKSSQKSAGGEELLKQLLAENEDLRVKVEEMRQELGLQEHVKTNLQLQLQKTQDSNAELIFAVQDLDEVLGQKHAEVSRLSSKLELRNDGQELERRCKCNAKENGEQLAISELEKVDGEENDRSELHQLRQKITDLCDEIEMYREDREKLESYIEGLTQEYEELKQENHVISSKLEQNQVEELRRQNECSESSAKITELESQLQWLEGKFQKQTRASSESVISISELDSQVKGLEKELEKQAQGFEKELEAMTNAKIEQEQRVIRLRKTTRQYASTAERLQEEFKRHSVEMAGKFEENEKLTKKAMEEAEELRLQNKILEDELVLTKDQNKIKLEEVSSHLDFKTKHVEQMSLELEDLSNQLRDVKKREEEKQEAFSVEIQMLKARIEKLNEESNVVREHSKQDAELRDQAEQMRISLAETRNLLESSKRERDELQRNFELAKKETRKTQEELCTLRSLKEEKDTTIKELLSEMEMLRTQHEELRHCLSSDELQKETLLKQILQLKDELHKVQDVRKVEQKNIIQDLPHSKRSTTKNKLATKEDNAAILERNESDLAELLKEMTLLKERNKSLESELKEMEERYAEISFKFAMAESARQELEMTNRQLMNGNKN